MTDNKYNDDTRLATWAKLVEAGNANNDPIKPLADITEQDMDAWLANFLS